MLYRVVVSKFFSNMVATWWIALCFLCLLRNLVHTSYNILMLTSPMGSKSHSIYFDGIARQLALQGNIVTHRCAGNVTNFEGITNYVTDHVHPDQLMANVAFDGDTFIGLIKAILKVDHIIFDNINSTYNEPVVSSIVANPFDRVSNKSKYDVVLIDEFFGELLLPLPNLMKVTAVLMTSSVLMSPYAWNLNVPYFYFFNYNGFKTPLDFIDRLRTFVFHFFLNVCGNFYMMPKEDELLKKFIPRSPSLQNLMSKVPLILTANPPSIQDTVPMMPNTVDIGCAHCRPPLPLPKELEDLMQKSGDHGVIFFSMGSFIKLKWIPNDFLNKLVSVLSQLPQTILWKGELEFKNFTNFYTADWFPQQDLLAHPKLRLVINNGGLGTMQEASYHGCPILGFPLMVDHFYAMRVAHKNGYGEYLPWRTFTEAQLTETIGKMLNRSSYKTSAVTASIRMKDVIRPQTEDAAYWVDYVIKHEKKIKKFSNNEIPWYQYFLLDVITFIAGILIAGISIALLFINFTIRRFMLF